MSRLNDALTECGSAVLGVSESNRLLNLRTRVRELGDCIELALGTPGSGDEVARARARAARWGLEIEQVTVSALLEIARTVRGIAGEQAVRNACAPIRSLEIDGRPRLLNGRPVEHPSPFHLPGELGVKRAAR